LSATPEAGGSQPNELQFDRAEYTAPRPAATCRACGQPLRDVYYEVNGHAFCQECREQLQESLSSGSPLDRFARATLYGSLAGLAGAAIYYGVREATQIEFGLISVVVGLMIGKAVKKGSNARGGWFYQGLAMFLTYTAIVATYVPVLTKAAQAKAADKAGGANPQQAAKPAGAAEAPADADARPRPSVPRFLFALVVLVGLVYALPVLIGFHNPMGLIIIGIGLYEAWVINRRSRIIINGPYQIGQSDAGSALHVEPAG
jgi:hypothetical protein